MEYSGADLRMIKRYVSSALRENNYSPLAAIEEMAGQLGIDLPGQNKHKSSMSLAIHFESSQIASLIQNEKSDPNSAFLSMCRSAGIAQPAPEEASRYLEQAREAGSVMGSDIASIKFPARAKHYFERAGIQKVGDLVRHSDFEIWQAQQSDRNLGNKTRVQIRDAMGQNGLKYFNEMNDYEQIAFLLTESF